MTSSRVYDFRLHDWPPANCKICKEELQITLYPRLEMRRCPTVGCGYVAQVQRIFDRSDAQHRRLGP